MTQQTFMKNKEKKVIIFTAPSGAGKTTLVCHMLDHIKELSFSVSATTRSKRDHEEDGQDYYFLEPEVFQKKIENDEFLEWEEVYKGTCYGTLKSEVERIWSMGKYAIFDVDVKGAVNIKNYYGDQALAVFIRPPSVDALMNRLLGRKTETLETLEIRMARSRMELTYEEKFDTTVINDDLDTAKKDALAVVRGFLELEQNEG